LEEVVKVAKDLEVEGVWMRRGLVNPMSYLFSAHLCHVEDAGILLPFVRPHGHGPALAHGTPIGA
jgi:hypothetical protein